MRDKRYRKLYTNWRIMYEQEIGKLGQLGAI